MAPNVAIGFLGVQFEVQARVLEKPGQGDPGPILVPHKVLVLLRESAKLGVCEGGDGQLFFDVLDRLGAAHKGVSVDHVALSTRLHT